MSSTLLRKKVKMAKNVATQSKANISAVLKARRSKLWR